VDLPDETDAGDEIAQLSAQIAQLYELLNQNSQLRAQVRSATGENLDRAGYESFRSQLESTLAEREFLGQEIVRRVGRIADLQRYREQERQAKQPNGPADADSGAGLIRRQTVEQELQLGQELLDLASAQIAAVRRWNENPLPAKLQEFETEYAALFEKYRNVRRRLNDVRARLGDQAAPTEPSAEQ
jgi:hypothetical protein